MKIGPHSPSPPQLTSNKSGAGAKSRERDENTRSAGSEAAALQAERDTLSRIHLAHQTAAEAEKESRIRIENAEEHGTRALESELNRTEAKLIEAQEEAQKTLSRMQKEQSAEINRTRREGEKRVSDLTNYYRDTQSKLTRDGENGIRENQYRTQAQLDFETKNFNAELEQLKENRTTGIANLRAESDQKVQATMEETQGNYQALREKQQLAKADAELKFTEQYQNIQKQQAGVLAHMDGEISARVNKIRADSAQKLAAYEDQKEDPFYRLTTINAEVEETDNAYILRAEVPEHERKHVNVSIRGDQIVVSGYRKSQEKQNLAPGRTQASSSFQSYNETFPITWPVDSRGLKREFEDGVLVITIPKKLTYQPYKPFKADKVTQDKIEKPVFPNELPLEKFVEERLAFENPESADPEVKPKRLADRTLG